MLKAIKSVLGFSGVGETAIKIVEKLTGTDDSPDKKREFFLNYLKATKHQSVPRRIIAISITVAWLFLITICAWAYIAGRLYYDTPFNPAILLADDIKLLMKENLSEPMNIVLVFYFVMHTISGIKK